MIADYVAYADFVKKFPMANESSRVFCNKPDLPPVPSYESIIKLPYEGAIGRSLLDIAGDFVFAEAFGAKGDGVTDDTQALRDALDSKCSIYLKPNSRYLSGPIDLVHGGQKLMGAGMGSTMLVARDNAPFITISSEGGHEGKGIQHLNIDCTVHTAYAPDRNKHPVNYAIGAFQSGRTTFNNVGVYEAAVGYHVEECNHVVFQTANVGACKLKAYSINGGDDRTDLIFFHNCIGVGKKRPNDQIDPSTTGLYVEGMVNSITFHSFACIDVGYGQDYWASDEDFARGRVPALIYGFDVGVDFTWFDNYRFRRCSDVHWNVVYTNNSRNGNGIKISNECWNFILNEVRGGGHAMCNIVSDGREVKITGSAVSFSSQGTDAEGHGHRLLKYDSVVVGPNSQNTMITTSALAGRSGIGATCRHAIYIMRGAQNVLISDCDLIGAGAAPIRDDTTEGQVTIGPCRGLSYTAINSWMQSNVRGHFFVGEVVLNAQGGVASVVIHKGGSFFDPNFEHQVEFRSQEGTGAAGRAFITPDGRVSMVAVTNPGTGYVDAQAVVVNVLGRRVQPYQAPYDPEGGGIDSAILASGFRPVLLGNMHGTILAAMTEGDGVNTLLRVSARKGVVALVPWSKEGDDTDRDIMIGGKGDSGRIRLGVPVETGGIMTANRRFVLKMENGDTIYLLGSSE